MLQSFQQWPVGNRLQELLDGLQAGAIFEAVPGEQWLGPFNSHGRLVAWQGVMFLTGPHYPVANSNHHNHFRTAQPAFWGVVKKNLQTLGIPATLCITPFV